jgi:hypothetical protein
MLPENLHRYFWENKPDDIDPAKHSAYIIERLLEHGNDEAVRWVITTDMEVHVNPPLVTVVFAFPINQLHYNTQLSIVN